MKWNQILIPFKVVIQLSSSLNWKVCVHVTEEPVLLTNVKSFKLLNFILNCLRNLIYLLNFLCSEAFCWHLVYLKTYQYLLTHMVLWNRILSSSSLRTITLSFSFYCALQLMSQLCLQQILDSWTWFWRIHLASCLHSHGWLIIRPFAITSHFWRIYHLQRGESLNLSSYGMWIAFEQS